MTFLSHWPALRAWKLPYIESIFPDENAYPWAEYTVTTRSERFDSENIPCHLCSNIPETGSVAVIGGQLVATPELLFLQLSYDVGTVLLSILLGNLMCCQGPNNQPPITTPEKLYKYAKKARMIWGRPRALDALTYIKGTFESPMEIFTYMTLNLPYRLGGCNLYELEVVNGKVPITSEEAASLGQRANYLKPDLLDPVTKLIVEYNGAEFHRDKDHDNLRRDILKAHGYRVFFVEAVDLFDLQKLEKLRVQLSIYLRHRIRIRTIEFEKNLRRLRRKLPKSRNDHPKEIARYLSRIYILPRVR